jgi:hypothetical protein
MTDSVEPTQKKKRPAPNGGVGRPPGTKNRAEGRRPFAVDAFRATQTMEWVAEFDTYVGLFRPSIADIHNRLKEAGYKEGWGSVQNWYSKNYPTGEEARKMNALAARMSGVQTHGMMEFSLVHAANVLDKAIARLGDSGMDGLPMLDVAKMIAPLAKEVRATSSKLNEHRVAEHTAELEMSGAIAVVDHLYQTFEDNPAILGPIKEACRAALAKLQGE